MVELRRSSQSDVSCCAACEGVQARFKPVKTRFGCNFHRIPVKAQFGGKFHRMLPSVHRLVVVSQDVHAAVARAHGPLLYL
jgi:hypothetical protein